MDSSPHTAADSGATETCTDTAPTDRPNDSVASPAPQIAAAGDEPTAARRRTSERLKSRLHEELSDASVSSPARRSSSRRRAARSKRRKRRPPGQENEEDLSEFRKLFADLGLPEELAPHDDDDISGLLMPVGGAGSRLRVFESPTLPDGVEEGEWDRGASRHRARESTAEDRVYRSDREFLKRQSHRKMIWFLRRVGLRHAAAVRTHLERVKHPEFEIPNLGCAYPHAGLSIAVDDRWECDEEESCGPAPKKRRKARGGGHGQATANMTYYQMYCASDRLVERAKEAIGPPKSGDEHYNKRVLTFIADIVGRLLWQTNRTHTVMFAKSDHYNRDCFLLYSRQAERTPRVMRSDSYFCLRHESDKFKHIAPQPDLTRANSCRLSSVSAVYVVGCDWTETWETFPFDYRFTNCRPMKPLYETIRRVDASVLQRMFSAVNAHANAKGASASTGTAFDVVSALLREARLHGDTIADDSAAYRDYVERFVTVGIMNVNCLLEATDGCRIAWGPRPPAGRLERVVLHSVFHRRETRELRTNRVFYYRNARDMLCSLSLVDDLFEDCSAGPDDIGECGEKNDRLVYFYDLLQAFEFDDYGDDVNELVFGEWTDALTTIHESSHTIGLRLTAGVLRGPPPDDPFYPSSTMSPTDIAIDRMLERAIKHSKKLKPLASALSRCPREPKTGVDATAAVEDALLRGLTAAMEGPPAVDDSVISNALSKRGENRLQDGYCSPARPVFETDHLVEHDGAEYNIKISFGGTGGARTGPVAPVDYGPRPRVEVYKKLVCAYLVDPTVPHQFRMLPGSCIVDKGRPGYVELNASDRIVRVFAVQAVAGDALYVIKPYVVFVFRNMPICRIDDELIDGMARIARSYDSVGDSEPNADRPPGYSG